MYLKKASRILGPSWNAHLELLMNDFLDGMCRSSIHGINDRLRDSMHYLYDRPEASFEDLLLAAMRAEIESRDHHITKAKAVTLVEPEKEAEASGVRLDDLNEQLKSLGQYLKSATFMTKLKFSKSNRDTQNQSQGPGMSPAGPF